MAPQHGYQFGWPPRIPAGLHRGLGFRNGVVPPASALRWIGDLLNQVVVQRQKILFKKSIRYGESFNSNTAADTWRFQFLASPNLGSVRARYILGPVEESAGSPTSHVAFWTTTLIGGGSTTQASIYLN